MKDSMLALAEMAVEIAGMLGCPLDYSAESIGPLDALLQVVHMEAVNGNLKDETVQISANAFGAYVGETLLRSGLADLGCDWMENGEGVHGIGLENAEFWASPITKVYKRIIQGPYHDLKDFFEVVLGTARGELDPLNDPRMHILSEGE